MRMSLASAAIAALCLHATTGYSWGQKAHQMVNRVAISMVNNPEAQKFLKANQPQVVAFASVPDTRWKNGPSANLEKPLHWFEIDGYSTTPFGEGVADMVLSKATQELGGDFTTKYGMAMWRTSDLFEKLVLALQEKDWDRAIQIGGVMGHYIGDMTQPMHATTDYDGQSIGKPGIHKYYETTAVDDLNEQSFYNSLLVVAGERRSSLERSMGSDMSSFELQHATYEESEGGFNAMDQILPRFEDSQYDKKWIQDDLTPRVARAAALLGKVWDVAFTVSGARSLPTQNLNVEAPDWIPMN